MKPESALLKTKGDNKADAANENDRFKFVDDLRNLLIVSYEEVGVIIWDMEKRLPLNEMSYQSQSKLVESINQSSKVVAMTKVMS